MGRNWTFTTMVVGTLVATMASRTEEVSIQVVNGNVVVPKECPKKDPTNETIHLAHEWDCTKFYKCDHGGRVLFECPFMNANGNRLHFNPVLQVCDWPRNAGCINGISSTTDENPIEVTTQLYKTERPTSDSTKITFSPEIPTLTTNSIVSNEMSTESWTISTFHEPSTERTTELNVTVPTTEVTTSRWITEVSMESSEISTSRRSTTEHATDETTFTVSKNSTEDPTERTTEITKPWLTEVSEKSTENPTETGETSSMQSTVRPGSIRPDLSTEISGKHTSTESSPTSEGTDINSADTSTPTTVRTTWSDRSTESSSRQTATEISFTDIETSSDPTPTTIRSTWPDVSTESSSEHTIAETITISATVRSTTPDITTETSGISNSEFTTIPTAENTTPVPTDDLSQTGTPTPSGIYVPHENNCSLFYEVIGDEKILKECPKGLHFSHTSLLCVWPAEAGCETTTTITVQTTTPSNPTCDLSCGDISHGSLIPHECVCEKYYKCSNGNLILHQCPNGLHFNKDISSCDLPNSAGCFVSTPEPTTLVPSPTIPSQCPPEESGQTIQFPHPTNCSLFYKCENGNKILQQCPVDLHFNPNIQMCDLPETAKCTATTDSTDNVKVTTEPTESETDITTDNYFSDGTGSAVTSVLPAECPSESNYGSAVYLRHPYNCTLYYVCDNGQKVVQSCPPGLEFNVVREVCDRTESVGCSASTWSSEGTEKSMIPTDSTTNYGTVGTTAIVIPTECPPENSGAAVNLPCPYNCSLYYRCDNGEKIVESCPTNLHFNRVKQVCDWPEFAGCVVSTTEKPWTTRNWSTASNESSKVSTTIPHSSSELSTRVPITIGRPTTYPTSTVNPSTRSTVVTETSTPKFTLIWTPIIRPSTEASTMSPDTTTNWIATSKSFAEDSTSSLITNPAFECPSDSYGLQIPHENNCSLYYECNGGKKELNECTPGLHFSSTLEICVWPANADCSSATISSDSITKVTDDRKVTDDQATQESSTSFTGAMPTTRMATVVIPGFTNCIGKCPITDPLDYTILLPNEDCTKFCKCSNSRAYVYNCPANLHFSPTTYVCDYPRRAKCAGYGGYGRPKAEVVEGFA